MATITLGAIITNNEGIHARTAAALLRVIKQLKERIGERQAKREEVFIFF